MITRGKSIRCRVYASDREGAETRMVHLPFDLPSLVVVQVSQIAWFVPWTTQPVTAPHEILATAFDKVVEDFYSLVRHGQNGLRINARAVNFTHVAVDDRQVFACS